MNYAAKCKDVKPLLAELTLPGPAMRIPGRLGHHWPDCHRTAQHATMRLALSALAALALCACAAAEPTKLAASDKPDCVREYPTGSNFPITVCRTRDDRDRQQQAADEVKDSVRRNPAVSSTAGRGGP
jgi:hypothetical protein